MWRDTSKMNPDFHPLGLYEVECKCTRNQVKYVTLMKHVARQRRTPSRSLGGQLPEGGRHAHSC